MFGGLEPCACCGFEPHGFGFQLELAKVYPHYEFCSMACQNVGFMVAMSAKDGKITGTKMLADIELQAIQDAREQFAEALERHRLMKHFENCTPAQIDDIIKSIVIGFQASVQKAYGRGEVPF